MYEDANIVATNHKTNVLFYRDYIRFQGGHLKVWHYFNHLKNSNSYNPLICFSQRSIQDKTNPWCEVDKLSAWSPIGIDTLFLAGLDWQIALKNDDFNKNKIKLPIINLIQGLSHAEPDDVKYQFLSERAIRICVSNQVSEAIQATGRVNGPIFTIPNGVDLKVSDVPLSIDEKNIDILIVAIKNPELGLAFEQRLTASSQNIKLITEPLHRPIFLDLLKSSKICLCLPMMAEGFYLPALEAMALEAIVICPDCIGNRSFCIDKYNSFMPSYDQDSLWSALQTALLLSKEEQKVMLENAINTARAHELQHEFRQFLDIMHNIKNLW